VLKLKQRNLAAEKAPISTTAKPATPDNVANVPDAPPRVKPW
jgi:hypothetical protein